MESIGNLNRKIFMILKYSGMYQINKVEDIFYFIMGYIEALDVSQYDKVFRHIVNYRDYLNRNVKIGCGPDWHNYIRLKSSSDKHSLELFEKSYTEFLKKEKIKIPEIK